jgi:hypothetical protein
MKLLLTISILVLSNILFGQIDYAHLNGSWTECVSAPSNDTLHMKPSENRDTSCTQSYQSGYYNMRMHTQFEFTDSVTVILTTSRGSSVDENAPTEDTTQMTITTIYDTTWTTSGEIKDIAKTEIKVPHQIEYSGGTSSMTIESSTYFIDLKSSKLIIDQGDRKLNYKILKLTKDELVLKNI